MKNIHKLCILVVLSIVFGYLLFNWIISAAIHSRKEVIVPDIKGELIFDALSLVSSFNLGLKMEGEEFNQDLPAGTEAIVMSILSPTEVSINPINMGLPEIVHPDSLKINVSFIGKLEQLSSDEDLQELLRGAEARLETEAAKKKTKKSSAKVVTTGEAF